MCGRYELHAQPAAIALAFGLPAPPVVAPRYFIAPMQQVPIVRIKAHGARAVALVRWGLVARWAMDPAVGAIVLIAVFSHLTGIQRLWRARRVLRGLDRGSTPGPSQP